MSRKKSISEEDKLEKYRKAGQIVAKAKEYIRPFVKVGEKLLSICEKAEQCIIKEGAQLAFPCNVSINHLAAHYSSPPGDKTVIEEGDVVKVDIGAHVDGFIADSAFTVNFDPEFDKLVEAAVDSCHAAIEAMLPGTNTKDIGKIVESTIKSKSSKFRPIKELSGHILDEYALHGPKTIPNVRIPYGTKIEAEEVYAVETFASTGSGSVHDLPYGYIYHIMPVRTPVRLKGSRKIISAALKEHKTLPFSERWIAKQLKTYKVALNELVTKGVLHRYKVLSDKKGCKVAQAEETMIVTKDGPEITTSIESD
ncbi:MAG: type II methionyl aminopeptidase [Promethearchaeota archaeon]